MCLGHHSREAAPPAASDGPTSFRGRSTCHGAGPVGVAGTFPANRSPLGGATSASGPLVFYFLETSGRNSPILKPNWAPDGQTGGVPFDAATAAQSLSWDSLGALDKGRLLDLLPGLPQACCPSSAKGHSSPLSGPSTATGRGPCSCTQTSAPSLPLLPHPPPALWMSTLGDPSASQTQ